MMSSNHLFSLQYSNYKVKNNNNNASVCNVAQLKLHAHTKGLQKTSDISGAPALTSLQCALIGWDQSDQVN